MAWQHQMLVLRAIININPWMQQRIIPISKWAKASTMHRKELQQERSSFIENRSQGPDVDPNLDAFGCQIWTVHAPGLVPDWFACFGACLGRSGSFSCTRSDHFLTFWGPDLVPWLIVVIHWGFDAFCARIWRTWGRQKPRKWGPVLGTKNGANFGHQNWDPI